MFYMKQRTEISGRNVLHGAKNRNKRKECSTWCKEQKKEGGMFYTEERTETRERNTWHKEQK